MMAGHTEIFRALVDLCKPNPDPARLAIRSDAVSRKFGTEC